MANPDTARKSSRLAITCVVAAALALLVWTWTAINPAVLDVARLDQERLPRLELIQRAQFADLEASIALRSALLLQDPVRSATELDRYVRLQHEAGEALSQLARLTRTTSTSEGATLLAAVLDARQRMSEMREAAARLERSAPATIHPDAMTAGLRPTFDEYARASQRLYNYESERAVGLVGRALITAERARLLLAAAGCVAAIALLLLVQLWRRDARAEIMRRDAEIRRLNDQRDALVSEVHHRIKNHLQGLLSLLEGQAAGGAIAEISLARLQAYVMTLVEIHGLQATTTGEQISLQELVARQVPLVRAGFPGARLALADDATAHGALVAGTHAVPLSLAVAELMLNAVKHGRGHEAHVQVFRREDVCCICVTNEQAVPGAFDQARGQGAGIGLQLVGALLQGIARIVQEAQPGGRMRVVVEIPGVA